MKINTIVLLTLTLFIGSCKQENNIKSKDTTVAKTHKETTKRLLDSLSKKGFETFSYQDQKTGDTIVMQKYFMAFLNRGDNRNQMKTEADSLQALHLEHLGKMYDMGYADISGPFGDDGEMRGITIYNVPTLKMADSLANADPMVRAGRLKIEIKPWWAAKGFKLR